MKQAIATSGWQFSGNRLLGQYAEEAYGLTASGVAAPPAAALRLVEN